MSNSTVKLIGTSKRGINFYVTTNGDILKDTSDGLVQVQKYIFNGYYYSQVPVNGVWKTVSVHRLVATAFIPNPDNLNCVNHKDENRLNNSIDNLEWCTSSYNIRYSLSLHSSTRRQKLSEAKKGNKNMLGKHHSEATKKKMSQAQKGRHWYNNGTKNVFAKECPEGYEAGMLKK